MNDVEAPQAETGIEPEPVTGFGRRLAAAREKLGLSVDEIAARLRLHPKQVRAIESEDLPALPAPFLRGFVRNYAKEVRLDPAPLVAELNAALGSRAGVPLQMASARSASALEAPSDHGTRRVVVVGVIAVLIVFAVVGGLATRRDRVRVEGAAGNATPAPPVATAPALPAAAEQKADAAAPPPVERAAAAASAAAPTAVPAPVAPPASESVRLSFRDESWVEVTQADGRVVHSQVNAAGTEQRVEGKPPLRLVIGNASAVAVDYKGKSIDLKPVTSVDNVARITLN
ncbi:MAG TPA: helix-turn-helix domain-containing protein [Burkholderiaceae bacterium]|nr:helix-turn-helix domain-containing protein [Burkholderiaceae bacterium]